jgi:SAM-dependent methyltransferase
VPEASVATEQPRYSFEDRKACPTCGCEDAETLFSERFANGQVLAFIERYYGGRLSASNFGDAKYEVLKCRGCGLLYQGQVLDEPSLEHFYEHSISAQESLAKRERAGADYFAMISRSAAMPHRLTPKPVARDVRVLDFGMGWGHWSVAAVALGASVFGAELSEKRRLFAARHGVEVIDPFADDCPLFDFINTDQVFEHLIHPLELARQLADKLEVGGVLKIFVPDAELTERAIRSGKWLPAKDALHPLEHVNGFTRSSLDRLAQRVGLEPVHPKEVFDGLRRLKYGLSRTRPGPSWYFRKHRAN